MTTLLLAVLDRSRVMTALLLVALLAAVAFGTWDNRRTRVTTSRNAERAVTAAVAARAAKDEAGRLAGIRAFDGMGVKR